MDIVERLRRRADDSENQELDREAAEEIDRLRDRVAELQAQWGYTESIQTLQIERLRGLLDKACNALLSSEWESERDLATELLNEAFPTLKASDKQSHPSPTSTAPAPVARHSPTEP